jgi:alpha-tubulin suppressor-like RCC1 family protein
MWGENCFFFGTPRGNLGNNSGLNSSSPVSVVGGFTDWCQVSAGSTHSLAIRQNSTAWAWGSGASGELGDNTAVAKSSPVSVVGGFTDWCQISAGRSFSLAVRTNGTLWAWGAGATGRLGIGCEASVSSPVSVIGGLTDWCQVAAAINTSNGSGVRQNGTLYAWGYNAQGQLGDNTTVSKLSPVSVIGGFTDWCSISLAYHSIALRQNGTIWAWGRGTNGQLGNNGNTNRSSPVSVIGGFTDWCQVSAGGNHSLAIRTNSSLWAWGQNNFGQLGTNNTTSHSSPVSVIGGFTDWCQVSGSYQQSFGLRTNGTLFSWGRNIYGSLGDNTGSTKSSPVSIAGGFTDWSCLSYPQSGDFSSGAIRSTL